MTRLELDIIAQRAALEWCAARWRALEQVWPLPMYWTRWWS